ncbi:MAG: aminopeptidase [Candidatus Eisenbacteria bacterium]|uniref:Aminopeptidase n=1 Tax=Eiseniibacteriota bacterium TaxID=2212470 RepID=A0A956LZF8_UNCEI|nr:aminopeptidase [Candidatus Eisenbacteria bacterium]
MTEPKLQDFEILAQVSEVKALAHTDRLAILGLIGSEPMTAAMLAKALDIPTSQANYHLNVLCREGLAWEVRKGRKRWKEERFCMAKARNYVVDPALGCHDPEASLAVRRSVEAAFLDWRRTQLLGVDLVRVARQVARQALRARSGQTVLVLFTPPALKIAGAIQVELRAVGADPRLQIWSRAVALATLDEIPAESLPDYSFLDPGLMQEMDAAIFLSSNMPEEGADPEPEQLAKLPHLLAASSRWHESMHQRRIPFVEVALPHRGEFEHGVTSPEDAIDTFWRCLEADGEALADRIRLIDDALRGSATIHIQCSGGTDLSVDIDHARAFHSDGVISDADIAAGRSFESLPAGSLSFLPQPGSGSGSLFASHVFAVGQRFREVLFRIRDGRIVGLESPHDLAGLRRALDVASGEPGRLAEVGVGVNPGGTTETGKPILDACMEGAVTLTFGNNGQLGGDVRSTLTLILSARDRSVSVAGRMIVEDGRIVGLTEA